MDDAGVIDIFRDSVLTVVPALTGMAVTHESTSQKRDLHCEDECAAVLDFAGEVSGMAAVGMSLDLARRLCAGAIGMDTRAVSPAMALDTLRELTNLVVGHSKARLEGTPYYYALTIPRTLADPGMALALPGTAPMVRVCFAGAGGRLRLYLDMCTAHGHRLAADAEPDSRR